MSKRTSQNNSKRSNDVDALRDFAPRCDILESLFRAKQNEKALIGGSFELCKAGTVQQSATCYFNSVVNGILFTPALALVAYFRMFEYIKNVFVPQLTAKDLQKIKEFGDIYDPDKCSLDDKLNIYMFFFSYFCHYGRVTNNNNNNSIDYSKYVLKNLHRQRSIRSVVDKTNVEFGGSSDTMIEPLFKKILKLSYKFVGQELISQNTGSAGGNSTQRDNATSRAVPDVLVVRYPSGAMYFARYLAIMLWLIYDKYGNRIPNKQNAKINAGTRVPDELTGRQVYDDLEKIFKSDPDEIIADSHDYFRTYRGFSKYYHIKLYDRILQTIRHLQEMDGGSQNTRGTPRTYTLISSKHGKNMVLYTERSKSS
jgi:hypothetical protein